MPAGRPSQFTPELAASIVERLHTRSLVKICQEDDDLPTRETIQRWMFKYPDFASDVAYARSQHSQFLIERTTELVQACDETNFRSAKVKMENAQWLAERLLSKEYGNKLQVQSAVIHLNMPNIVADDYSQVLHNVIEPAALPPSLPAISQASPASPLASTEEIDHTVRAKPHD